MNLESSEDENKEWMVLADKNKEAYKTPLEIENTKEIDYQFSEPKDV